MIRTMRNRLSDRSCASRSDEVNIASWIGLHSPSSIACLLVSAFFAASETALTGASRASMLRLSKQGNRDAGVVSSLSAMRERLIGALLLGNNIANIGASALATGIFTAWFGEVGVLYATAVMTVLVVIFAEVLPKTIAINAPDRVALAGRAADEGHGVPAGAAAHRRRGDRPRADAGCSASRSATTSRSCRRSNGCAARSICFITKARSKSRTATCSAGFSICANLQVSDVMVHRTEMVMINADLPPEELVREVLATEYTRIPLWRDKPENIIGVLHAKDLLRAIRAADGDTSKIDVSTIGCRHGSCRKCARFPNSSRRSAAARPTSRWWSTNMARSKAW